MENELAYEELEANVVNVFDRCVLNVLHIVRQIRRHNLLHLATLRRRSTADFFKKSLFMMANISLITKTFDTSPADGRITLNELSQLESGTTEDLFNLLEAAIGAVSQTDQSGNLATAAEKISGIRNSIAEQSGSDDTEKLKEFLINATNENASNL